MVDELIPFLAILNPFALCLYLEDSMHELDFGEFARVAAGASGISLFTFWVCALGGRPLLVDGLGVMPAALRLFGGVIFFVVAYNYVMKGHEATAELRGSVRNFPSAIALPFMIGAGTITQAIFIGEHLPWLMGLLVILLGIVITFGILLSFKLIGDHLKRSRERVFYRYVDTVARLNGLIIGAISAQMMVLSMHDLWDLGA